MDCRDLSLIVLQGLDAGTSDDSGRASEQLHGPGIPRDCQDADSSRDHLSDVSFHEAKKYYCPDPLLLIPCFSYRLSG